MDWKKKDVEGEEYKRTKKRNVNEGRTRRRRIGESIPLVVTMLRQ